MFGIWSFRNTVDWFSKHAWSSQTIFSSRYTVTTVSVPPTWPLSTEDAVYMAEISSINRGIVIQRMRLSVMIGAWKGKGPSAWVNF